jgi:hypothetical protein
MTRARLHLFDGNGIAIGSKIERAVERSFQWVLRDYPQIDPALIANWAEEVARGMQAREHPSPPPQRYANAALKGRVRDWMRSGAAQEQMAGVGPDLERIGGLGGSFQNAVDRKILFEQVNATLNERDRYILVLLLQDNTSPTTIADTQSEKAVQTTKR